MKVWCEGKRISGYFNSSAVKVQSYSVLPAFTIICPASREASKLICNSTTPIKVMKVGGKKVRAAFASPAQVAVSPGHTGGVVETRRWAARTLLLPATRWEHITICADTFGGLQTATEQSRSPVSSGERGASTPGCDITTCTSRQTCLQWENNKFMYTYRIYSMCLCNKDKGRKGRKCRKSVKCGLNKLWEGNNAELNRVKSHIILLLGGGGANKLRQHRSLLSFPLKSPFSLPCY